MVVTACFVLGGRADGVLRQGANESNQLGHERDLAPWTRRLLPGADPAHQLAHAAVRLEFAGHLIAAFQEPGDHGFAPPSTDTPDLGSFSLGLSRLISSRQPQKLLGSLNR